MTDKMKQFLDEAEKDEALAEALGDADSPEHVIALAKEKGYELTEEDLRMEDATGELSDDELEDVAGGVVLGPMGLWSGLSSFLVRRFGRKSKTSALTYHRSDIAPAAQPLPSHSGFTGVTENTLVFRGDDKDFEYKPVSL